MSNLPRDLQKVALTLLLPLWGRAQMTRAGSPILSDPGAVELVDDIARQGFDFAPLQRDLTYFNNLVWLARARQFDDRIKAFLADHPHGPVVNLGAGLDTTFARVDNGKVLWFDLDLPPVAELRRQLIPPTERSRLIAQSLLDRRWMQQIPNGPVLLVAGGLVYYFRSSALRALFRSIGQCLPEAQMVFDALSPYGVHRANRMLARMGMDEARVRWGMKDPAVLKSWDERLEVLEVCEVFCGLDLSGTPWFAHLMAFTNRWLQVLRIIRCRWTAPSADLTVADQPPDQTR